jgi:hypothetical protein
VIRVIILTVWIGVVVLAVNGLEWLLVGGA